MSRLAGRHPKAEIQNIFPEDIDGSVPIQMKFQEDLLTETDGRRGDLVKTMISFDEKPILRQNARYNILPSAALALDFIHTDTYPPQCSEYEFMQLSYPVTRLQSFIITSSIISTSISQSWIASAPTPPAQPHGSPSKQFLSSSPQS